MNDNQVGPIPDAALAMLKHAWRQPESVSVFDRTLQSRPHGWLDPSVYFYYRGDNDAHEFCFMTYAEAQALVSAGVFRALAHIDGKAQTIAVNEHAQHAFDDFCGEACAA